ncbi:alpha/beta hydrolase family protein [Laceyella putida]|uniref:Alpha/beta hydrolase family protein n=1 Tax=Laceyella putida TaxID=110101 RepID=A0ABW2RLP4_9BACL
MNRYPFALDLGKEDRIIRGDLFLPDTVPSAPTVLICHGFKGFKDWGFFPTLGQRLAEAGLAAITFNFSMNGVGKDLEHFTELEKFSRNTFSHEQEDLVFLIEALRQGALPQAERCDLTRLGIMGHSRGGGNSLLYALDHPDRVKAVTIWNSIHRVDFFSPELIEELRNKGISHVINGRTGQRLPIRREVLEDIEANRERFDLLGRLPHLKQPLLLVQGDQDLPGLYEGAVRMAEAAPQATLHVIQGANHTMGAVHPFAGMTPQLEEAIRVTADFFVRELG